jgi:predicted phage terminase large subunit-like protein
MPWLNGEGCTISLNDLPNPAYLPVDEITDFDILAATQFALEAARNDLLAFVLLLYPDFALAPHHRLICDELMMIESGENDRLMIFLSPRSSKSTIASVYFPAWCIGRKGNREWIQISHSDDLARQFGGQVRDIIDTDMFRAIFPKVEINPNRSAMDDWQLKRPYSGKFKAAGSGKGLAGYGANIIMIDDPLSEQDAFSKAKRHSINRWYPGGVRSRLMPGGGMVIVQTRWMEDDLSGYLLAQEDNDPFVDKWRVVKIPAFNTHESLLNLQRATKELKDANLIPSNYANPVLGESFWPDTESPAAFHWSTEMLLRTKHSLPGYQWDALYMQEPSAEEGGIFKTEYWRKWEEDKSPIVDYVLMSIDPAFSTRNSADFSAIQRWGLFMDDSVNPSMYEDTDASLILLGAKKGRWDFPTLRDEIIRQFNEERVDAILIEKKASGQSIAQELRMAGLPVFEYSPDRDKVSRAHACTHMLHNGKIFIPAGKLWAEEVTEECRKFPNATYDDHVDALTQAIWWFRESGMVATNQVGWKQEEEYDRIYTKPKKRSYYA